MTAEIIVEFPSPLTEKEQRMICGYKGELIRCKECIYRDWGGFCTGFGEGQYVGDDSYCSNGEREEE